MLWAGNIGGVAWCELSMNPTRGIQKTLAADFRVFLLDGAPYNQRDAAPAVARIKDHSSH